MTDREGYTKTFPCGRCPKCTARRTSAWSFRLMQQEKISSSAYFVTLTYDTDYVPISKRGFMSVCKRHPQLFFKRLRRLSDTSSNIKYYLVAEYGGRTFRPHYHAIIFNAKVELIEKSWQYGMVHIGTVTGASIGYTLKYISKPGKIPLHKNDDRHPEFSLMSKKLGKNYLTPQMIAWHKEDPAQRVFLTLEGGKKAAMPRYYKDKIYDYDERLAIKAYHTERLRLQEEKTLERADYDKFFEEREKAIEAAFRRQKFNSSKNQKL